MKGRENCASLHITLFKDSHYSRKRRTQVDNPRVNCFIPHSMIKEAYIKAKYDIFRTIRMLALGFSTSTISIRCSCKIMKSLFALVWQSSLDGRLTKTWPAFRFGICYRTLSFIMATPSSSQKASTSASIPSTTPGQMKNKKSVVGAPSQRAQASRKGKKAWRKNIDIDDVEERLEELRVEERVTGYVAHYVNICGLAQATSNVQKFGPSPKERR